jgi:hypothetical protein
VISLAILSQTFAQMRESRNTDDGMQLQVVRRRELTVGSSATCARRGSLLVARLGSADRRPAGPLTEVNLPRADPQQHHGLLWRKGGHIDQPFDALVAVGRGGTRPRPSRFITESGVTRRNGRSRDFGHLAVANAIFAGTGKRPREMPIDTTVLKRPV